MPSLPAPVAGQTEKHVLLRRGEQGGMGGPSDTGSTMMARQRDTSLSSSSSPPDGDLAPSAVHKRVTRSSAAAAASATAAEVRLDCWQLHCVLLIGGVRSFQRSVSSVWCDDSCTLIIGYKCVVLCQTECWLCFAKTPRASCCLLPYAYQVHTGTHTRAFVRFK